MRELCLCLQLRAVVEVKRLKFETGPARLVPQVEQD